MTPFLSFFVKANLVIILLYGFYFLCFRHDTFYGYIRWYMLASILSAIVFPLIDIPVWVTNSFAAPEVSQYVPDVSAIYQNVFTRQPIEYKVEPTTARTIPFGLIFFGCWIPVAVLMLCKRLFQLAHIVRFWRRYPQKPYGNHLIVAVERNIQPFSFFGRIFLNPSLYSKDELDEIVSHEHIHCRQGHTFDILLVEILVCLCWFNPVTWLLRHDLKQNIEFYTDRMTLLLGFNRKHYQYSLLRVSESAFQIVNHFHFNPIKKRIIMMNKKESPRIISAKYLLVIPVLTVALLTVQISSLQAGKIKDTGSIIENPVRTEVIELPAMENIESNMALEAIHKKSEKALTVAPVLNINVQNPDSITQGNVLQKKDKVKASSNDPLIVLDGKVISSEEMKNIDPVIIESISVLKDPTVLNSQNIANGIILITTKTGTNTDNPQEDISQVVRVSGNVTAAKDGQALPGVAIIVNEGTTATVTDMHGNYVLDVPTNATLQFKYIGMDLREVAVKNRQQINVVMETNTQSEGIDNVTNPIKLYNHSEKNNKPLLIVNGKEVDGLSGRMENISTISPYNIEKIDVLKGEAAILKYGEKGKNGVVIITTKKYTTSD